MIQVIFKVVIMNISEVQGFTLVPNLYVFPVKTGS